MKLKSLHIENIASIADATIDFEASPLRESDLFLINGETGSGKTTIIDAICLALYNQTPRLKEASSGKLQFGDYKLTPQNSANMLRHGATDGKAELVFEGNDGVIYTAIWSAHRTPSAISTKCTLNKDGIEIGSGTEMKATIENSIVGMKYDDFCRTAVLAQGEFTKFLKCDDDTKAAILEKLTGTERFAEVGKMIFTILGEKKEALTKAENEVNKIELLPEEQKQELNDEIKRLEEQIKQWDTECTALQEQLTWLRTLGNQEQELAKAQEELKGIQEITNADQYKSETKMLADWNISQDAIHTLNDLDAQTIAKQGAETEEAQLQSDYAKATAGLLALKKQLETNQKENEQCTALISSKEADKEMLLQSKTIIAHLQNARSNFQKAEKKRKEAKNLSKQKPSLEEKAKKAEEAFIAAEKKVANQNSAIQQKNDEITALGADSIIKEQKQLNTRDSQLTDASLALQKYETAIKKAEEEQQALDDLVNARKTLDDELAKLTSEKKKAISEFELAEKLYKHVELTAEDWAEQARQKLSDGDFCPVCGQKYSVDHFKKELLETFTPYKEQYDSASQNKETATKKYNDKNSECTTNGNEQVKKQESLAKAKEQQGKCFDEALKACQQISITLPEDSRNAYTNAIAQGSSIRKEINNAKKANEEKLKTLTQKQGELKTLNDTLIQYNTELTTAQGAKNEALQKVKECVSQETQAEEDAKQFQKSGEDDKQKAAALISINNWETSWTADSETFEKQLTTEAQKYTDAVRQQGELELKITEINGIISGLNNQSSSISTQWPAWKASTVADEQQVKGLSELWTKLIQDSTRVKKALDDSKKAINDDHTKLDKFYKGHTDIDDTRLKALKNFDAVKVSESHKLTDELLNQKNGAFKKCQESLNEHQSKRPEQLPKDQTIENLQDAIQKIEKDKNDANSTIGANKCQLETEAENVVKLGDKKKIYEQIKTDYDEWKTFCDIYGDKEGKTFRRMAQQLVFDSLLVNANKQLERLDNRYQMETIAGSLAISLRDLQQPDFCSPVSNLSGGESFLVSLSLALALNAMGREGISMDTLFIDEGFGTLSSNNQIKVIDMLETLQKQHQKRVGIISHVEYLKERIDTQILVERTNNDSSSVSVISKSRNC